MSAAIRSFIAFLLIFLLHARAEAQISVELLNRADSFAFLGTGSDNKVRIHNLPNGAKVMIAPGTAVHVRDNEYVLCRFGACKGNDKGATLTVVAAGKTLFTKRYKLLYTPVSRSGYNPLLRITFGYHPHQQMPDTTSMTTFDFNDKIRHAKLMISPDTSIVIESMTFGMMPGHGCDYVGPYTIGVPDTNWHSGMDNTERQAANGALFQKQFRALLQRLDVHYGRIFLECIEGRGADGSIYAVETRTIRVR